MSIFDRFKDIASFLNTRPEARTKEQEQVGKDLEETAQTVQNMAEDRLEGVTDEEARSLSELVRDFFSSDEKGIKEFREKNKQQIAKDKKLVGNILGKTPVGMLRNFIVKQAVKNYGPQIAETASKFLSQFQPPEKKGSQFEFMGTIYNMDDFFKAGKVNYDAGTSYEIDKNRSRVSPIKAFIELLPDDYSKSPEQVYNDFRQIKKNFPNTPFADYFSMAEFKESGLEFSLLRAINANKERGDMMINKATLLATINSDDLNPNTKKVRFAREDEARIPKTTLYIQRLNELNAQLANLYDKRYLRESYSDLTKNYGEEDIIDTRSPLDIMRSDVASLIEMTNQSYGDNREMTNDKYLQLLAAANENYKDMALETANTQAQAKFGMSYDEVLKEFEELNKRFGKDDSVDSQRYFDLQTFKNNFDTLLNKIDETLELPQTNQELLSFLSGTNQPSYLNTGPSGLKNYDVQGITIQPREGSILGERNKDSTHFSGSWTGQNPTDAFHYRTGQLQDPNGVIYNTLVEVQSDTEGSIRKNNRYYDPSLTYQSENLAAEINDFRENNIGKLQELYKLDREEIAKTKDIAGIMMDGDIFLSASSDQIKEEINRLYGDKPPIMIDNIPEANRQNYLDNNTRADEIFKYMKKLNKHVENQYRLKKIENESQPGRLSKTIPYVSTGPQGYAEEAIYQYILDSIRTGVDKVTWVPGEHAAQFQLSGPNTPSGDEFSNTETTLNSFTYDDSIRKAQGMINFYGSVDTPKDNTMYKAADVVIKKLTKLGKQIYGDDFVAPVLYEQGAKDEEGRYYNSLDINSFKRPSSGERGYTPNVFGWAFIDLKPTLEYLKENNYDKPAQEMDEGLLQNYVTRKRGGQIQSPSLLSLDEVING